MEIVNKTFPFTAQELARLHKIAEADRRSMAAEVKYLIDQAYIQLQQKEAS